MTYIPYGAASFSALVDQVLERKGLVGVDPRTRRRANNALNAAINMICRLENWWFMKAGGYITTSIAVTNATYADTGYTLTKPGETFLTKGVQRLDQLVVTDGTGATTGTYTVAAVTEETLTLSSSIGAAADGQTDIDCTVYPVRYNLAVNYPDVDTILWMTSGDESYRMVHASYEFIQRHAATDTTPGRPAYYWRDGDQTIGVYPRPDQAYTLTFDYRRRPGRIVDDGAIVIPDVYHDGLAELASDLYDAPRDDPGRFLRNPIVAQMIRDMRDRNVKESHDTLDHGVDYNSMNFVRYIDVQEAD